MPRELSAFFCPKSVAIVGASREPKKIGAIILKNIINSGFSGSIFPVNPSAEQINDIPCFKDINSLPTVPDLVVLTVPAVSVLEVLKKAGEKGVKNVVVIAAGFKETGPEGEKLELDLIQIANQYQINLLGPNCMGFVNQTCPINATFGQPVSVKGNLRFLTQSGAIAASLFDWCQATGLGFKEFVTLGNKAVLNEGDVLSYFQAHSDRALLDTEAEGLSNLNPICLYLESISNGAEFLRLTSEITKTNPVLLLSPGKTEASHKAMQSHTGALAGEDDVLDAVLKDAGVLRCGTLEDFYDLAKAFAWENLPEGPKVAIISNAGGPAVISADAVIKAGLELVEFDEETKRQLEGVLPRSASIVNPVDLLGDALADRYAEAMDIILQKDSLNALVVILTPQVMTQIEVTAKKIVEKSQKYQKPIFCSFMGGASVAEGEKILNRFRIPSYHFPERAIAAIGVMWEYRAGRSVGMTQCAPVGEDTGVSDSSELIKKTLQTAVAQGQKSLDNISANQILTSLGVNTPPTQLVQSVEEAKIFAQQNGWPVVLKLSVPGLLHKAKIGGVITDIMDDSALGLAWQKLEGQKAQIQIQKQVKKGVEVILGIKEDTVFGPMLLFGVGGSLAEMIEDRNLHRLPIGESEIKKLIENSKVFRALSDKAQGLDKLYELVGRFVKIWELTKDIGEIEINPIIVTEDEAWAVDGKVILVSSGPQLKSATCLKSEVLATQFHHYEFESAEPLVFKAGQYLSVKVAEDAIRSYSIASHNNPNHFDFLVDTRPGGSGSKFFENLKEGDKMSFLGPFGVFTLNLEDGAEQLLFLATGTGISAIRCIIEEALKEKQVKIPINLYFGLTHVEEIFWRDCLDELAQDYPNFHYEIAILEPDESWQGHKGYNTELMQRDFPETCRSAAYLCGHPAMIAAATEILKNTGCPENRIYSENFA